jgi:hypothetical protein
LAPFARAALVLTIGAISFAMALRSSVANVFQNARPAQALAWQANHASANANVAQRFASMGRADLARQFANRALTRSLLEPEAYAALGLAAELSHNARAATAYMHLSLAASRRERLTSAWLIRSALQDGNYAAAVQHFDVAMRTTSRGVGELVGLLVAATADRRMADALRPILLRNPAWRPAFLYSLAINGPSLENTLRLSWGMLDPQDREQRRALAVLMSRLIRDNHFDAAWSLYRQARPQTPQNARGTIRDSNYVGRDGLSPFDWDLTEEPGLAAVRELSPDGSNRQVLRLVAEEGRTGLVARQLVRLQPGAHQLAFDAGDVPSEALDRQHVSIRCARDEHPILEIRPAQPGAAAQPIRATFVAAGQCGWYWVEIRVGSSRTPSDYPWVANFQIR